MSTSFIDNNARYIKAFIDRDYSSLSEEVLSKKGEYDFYIEENDTFVGYSISVNKPVSKLYGFDVYVVRFHFSNFNTLHEDYQEKMCNKLVSNLSETMEKKAGYYNLRIPTHMVDLIRACNKGLSNPIMCGGTVEEYISGKNVDDNIKNGLKVFFADAAYINEHRDVMMSMTYESFKSYQGQYHLSPVTSENAGKIYENWISSSLNIASDDKVVVAEHEGEIIGFVTITEHDYAVDGILSAVDGSKRKLGAYKAMISFIINYANSLGKAFITSTQFDNFIVQGTWNSLGLRPFYSIYNIHYDCR